jgi:beta-N-acetylhexosaminidase
MAELEKAAAKMIAAGFHGMALSPELEKILDRGVGAVVLFKRNVESAKQVAQLCSDIQMHAGRPVLIAVDQEGGRVARLRNGFTPIPSMRALGASGDGQLAFDIGRVLARELRAVNIHMDLAPVLDVDSNPANPVIGDRSFGSDPQVVSKMAVALLRGLQDNGVAACGKHFPGHGDTSQDSHLDLPRLGHSMERLNQIELPPFRAAIGAGVSTIMTAHIIFEALDPAHPATMSKPVLDGLLRRQMRFDGVIISDALEMKAIADNYAFNEVIIKGANAGIDLFAICDEPDLQHQAIDTLAAAVRTGKISEHQIVQANQRIDRLLQRYVRPPTEGESLGVLNSPQHRAIVERLMAASPSGIDPTEKPIT